MTSTVRETAYQILLRVDEEEAFPDKLLQHHTASLDPKEASFLTRLVKTCIEQQSNLDKLVGRFSSHPLHRVNPAARAALRLAAAQIEHFDTIESSLAVNSAVELAKTRGGEGAGKFVNAVLRNMLRTQAKVRRDPTAAHPEWLVQKWQTDLGRKQAENICKTNDAEAVNYARVNLMRSDRDAVLKMLDQDGYRAQPVEPFDSVIRIDEANKEKKITETKAFEEGYIYLQDLSAIAAVEVIPDREYKRILDPCAAPGGKASHLAERFSKADTICASDLYPTKVARMVETKDRLQIPQLLCAAADIFRPPYQNDFFDLLFLDVPCSGTGVIGRKPDLRQNLTSKRILEMSLLQRATLQFSSQLVSPGGVLCYSTCSLEPEENQQINEWFLDAAPNFQAIPIDRRFEDIQLEENSVRILPTAFHSCGGYLALYERTA